MARCPECGQRTAFGAGRNVVPALSSVKEILSDLREDQAGGGPSVAGMISDGERHRSELHTAAHNMSAVYVNWPSIQEWIDQATRWQWDKVRNMQNP